MVTPAARREAVAHLRLAFEVSERRACSTLGADRTSIRYRSMPSPWSAMRQLSARAVSAFSGGRVARSHIQAGQRIHLERVGRDRVSS